MSGKPSPAMPETSADRIVRRLDAMAFELASADPLGAVKVLARALRAQSRGGQLTACRILIEALADRDPALLPEIRSLLERMISNV